MSNNYFEENTVASIEECISSELSEISWFGQPWPVNRIKCLVAEWLFMQKSSWFFKKELIQGGGLLYVVKGTGQDRSVERWALFPFQVRINWRDDPNFEGEELVWEPVLKQLLSSTSMLSVKWNSIAILPKY